MRILSSAVLATVTASLLAIVPTVVHAAEVSVGTDVATAYVWRGITFNDEGAVQPWVDVAHESGVGVNVWGNFDIGDFGGTIDDGEFSEVDLTLYYGLPIDAVDVTVGVIHYMFPQAGADTSTGELFASVGMGVVDGVSVSASVNYDYDEIGDVYANVGGAIDITSFFDESPEGFGLEFAAAVGFAGVKFAKAYGGKDAGAFDYNLSTTASYDITDSLSGSLWLAYTDSADSDVLPDQQVDIYAGGGISYSF